MAKAIKKKEKDSDVVNHDYETCNGCGRSAHTLDMRYGGKGSRLCPRCWGGAES